MKNILSKFALILILGFLVVLMPSCKKDDNTPKSEIIGTWTFGETEVIITAGGIDMVQYLMSNFGLSTEEAQAVIELFMAENDLEELDFAGTIAFNEDNTYRESLTGSNEDSDGTWEITNNGKTLNLDSQASDEDKLSIITLTSNSLILGLVSITEQVDFNDDGVDETTINIEIQLNLSK